ncbi:hypothetical protein WDU94_013863 [Cyamophila willieti]
MEVFTFLDELEPQDSKKVIFSAWSVRMCVCMCVCVYVCGGVFGLFGVWSL